MIVPDKPAKKSMSTQSGNKLSAHITKSGPSTQSVKSRLQKHRRKIQASFYAYPKTMERLAEALKKTGKTRNEYVMRGLLRSLKEDGC